MRSFLLAVSFVNTVFSCNSVCQPIKILDPLITIGPAVTPQIESNATTAIIRCPSPPNGYISPAMFEFNRYLDGLYDGSYTYRIDFDTKPEVVDNTYTLTCNKQTRQYGLIQSHSDGSDGFSNTTDSFLGIKPVWCFSMNPSNSDDMNKNNDWYLGYFNELYGGKCQAPETPVARSTQNTVSATATVVTNSSNLLSVECQPSPGYDFAIGMYERVWYLNGEKYKTENVMYQNALSFTMTQCVRYYGRNGYAAYMDFDPRQGTSIFITKFYCHAFNLAGSASLDDIKQEIIDAYS